MRSRDLINELKASGCRFVREGKGSHQIWFSPLTGKKFVVPHPNRSIPIGTLKAIIKAAGIEIRSN